MDNTTYFAEYEESTLDPGWSLVLGSLIACTLLHLALPCIVSLGSRYERRRHVMNGVAGNGVNEVGMSPEDSSQGSGQIHARDDIQRALKRTWPPSNRQNQPRHGPRKKHHASQKENGKVLEVVKEDDHSDTSIDQSETSMEFKSKQSQSAVVDSPGRDGLVGWFSGIADALIIPSYDDHSSLYTPTRAPSTIHSTGSHISTASKTESSVLRGRPGRQPGLKRSKRSRQASDQSVRQPSMNRSNMRPTSGLSGAGREKQTNYEQNSSRRSASNSQKECVSRAGSVMSRLHHDDVSFTEAIDSYRQAQYLLPTDETSGEVDILCGERAWWKPSMIMGAVDRVIGVSEYDEELSEIVKLAIPFSLQSFVAALFNIVDIALVSHLVGGSEASAFIVVPLLTWITNTLNYGFCESLGKTIPVAMGKTHDELSGKYLNTSLSLYTVGMVPTAIIWTIATKQLFLWIGFDEATAELAQEYAYMQILLEWITGIEYCIHLFLDIIGHEKYSTYTMFVQNFGQTLGIVLPVILLGHRDLILVGFFRVVIAGILMFVDTCIVLYYGWIESFARGFLALPFKEWDVVQAIRSRAGLLGVAYFLTYGQWELLALFASALGPAEIVTWGILGHIWSNLKYISDGISDAAEVRCGLHLMSNQPELARLAAYKSLFLGFAVSVLVTSILFMAGEEIASLITPEVTLQRLMVEVFPLIGIGHIVMTSGIISWALVGAQGRYNLATLIHLVGNWGVTFPLSCLFTFVLRVDLQGLASAMVIGLSISGFGNLYVLVRSQWARIAMGIGSEDDSKHNDWSMDEIKSVSVPNGRNRREAMAADRMLQAPRQTMQQNNHTVGSPPGVDTARVQRAPSHDGCVSVMSSVSGYSY